MAPCRRGLYGPPFEVELSRNEKTILLPLGEGGAAKREPDRAKHKEKAPDEGNPSHDVVDL
jgi:hypothetical protein